MNTANNIRSVQRVLDAARAAGVELGRFPRPCHSGRHVLVTPLDVAIHRRGAVAPRVECRECHLRSARLRALVPR